MYDSLATSKALTVSCGLRRQWKLQTGAMRVWWSGFDGFSVAGDWVRGFTGVNGEQRAKI